MSKDKDFDFIDVTFSRIVKKKEIKGEGALTSEERIVLLIWHASGVIENGGLTYFFEQELDPNASADAYLRIGSPRCAELLKLGDSLFPEFIANSDLNTRVAFLESSQEMFENLSREFWKMDKKTESLLANFIRSNQGKIL